jgi:hypothetical protein
MQQKGHRVQVHRIYAQSHVLLLLTRGHVWGCTCRHNSHMPAPGGISTAQ